MKDEKLDFDKNSVFDLLEESLKYLNMIPRKNIKSKNTRDSYELADLIGKYLKNVREE